MMQKSQKIQNLQSQQQLLQPKFELFPETETEYYLKVVEDRMEFHINENNTVTGLTLFQNGQKMPAQKI